MLSGILADAISPTTAVWHTLLYLVFGLVAGLLAYNLADGRFHVALLWGVGADLAALLLFWAFFQLLPGKVPFSSLYQLLPWQLLYSALFVPLLAVLLLICHRLFRRKGNLAL